MNIPLTFYYQHDSTPATALLINAINHSACHRLIRYYNPFDIDVYVLLDNPNSQVIALDWDNTVTADIGFYSNLINTYIHYGWNPIICTLRDSTLRNLEEINHVLARDDIQVYATDGVAKQHYMHRLNLAVHLWLDDYFPAICPCGCPLLLKNGIEL